MSIHRLSAGSGYRYLLRSVAVADTPVPARSRTVTVAGAGLAGYYAATGTPPGRWSGTGLTALGDTTTSIRAGDVVTETQLAALFGTGHDPVTDQALGRGYRVYASVQQRITAASRALPADLTPDARAGALARIREREQHRPVPVAVAGFDLTFTATKSVSVLWALSDEATRTVIEAAHHAAVTDTLAYLHRHAGYTRTGHDGTTQVRARGFILAEFDHWDTRTGDPNLHTHAVLANRVQGPDGAWRSVDSRALHHAAVAASELYDSLLADRLTRALPVRFAWRSRGERRSPAYELTGITDDLLAVFSTRSTQITTAAQDLITTFRDRTGGEPTRAQILRLRQQATLATRPDKVHRPLRELLTSWRDRAHAATGVAPGVITGRVCQPGRVPVRHHDQVVGNELATLTAEVLTGCSDRRATWSVANIHAQISRTTRHLPLASTGDRLALLDTVNRQVLAQCTPLYDTSPVRALGTGVHVQDRRYSHRDLLGAELQLLLANTTPTPRAPVTTEHLARTAATRQQPGRNGQVFVLAGDQVAAVVGVATAPHTVQVLVGPAGTGKTTTLRALAQAWGTAHGPGMVTGLATSATAADQLTHALGIPCDTTAKWLHETNKPVPGPEWQLHPGQLVIIDEAALTGTRTLHALTTHAAAIGAKVLLVGDHAQLDAVEAGGAFGLLARHGYPHQLHSLWRFTHRWEADATRALRAGDPESLHAYAEHDRVHAGPAQTMLDAAYQGWRTDTRGGRRSVLVAADTATVHALNARAHNERLTTGTITGPTIALGDTSTGGERGTVGVGDLVLTRRNDRTLTYPGGHVRNGQHWKVAALHADGAITLQTATAAGTPDQAGAAIQVTVPREYVRQHLDPGYAITIHRAQGITVDTAHLLTAPGTSRRALYVGMTRGRDANHLYLATDNPQHCEDEPAPPATSVHETLTAILGDDRTELSALETHAAHVGWRQAITAAMTATVPAPALITDPWAHDPLRPNRTRTTPSPPERTLSL